MSNLHDHDRTQVLSHIGKAIQEGQRDLNAGFKAFGEEVGNAVKDDGTSQVLELIPARYSANISFRRVDGDGWGGELGYNVDVNGPAKFVAEVLSAATGIFLDSEER
jgi:hypothetical protein